MTVTTWSCFLWLRRLISHSTSHRPEPSLRQSFWVRSPTTSKASPSLIFTRSSLGVCSIQSSPMTCWVHAALAPFPAIKPLPAAGLRFVDADLALGHRYTEPILRAVLDLEQDGDLLV